MIKRLFEVVVTLSLNATLCTRREMGTSQPHGPIDYDNTNTYTPRQVFQSKLESCSEVQQDSLVWRENRFLFI